MTDTSKTKIMKLFLLLFILMLFADISKTCADKKISPVKKNYGKIKEN